uniref:Uncharacterized protein n=1 Tax=Glossina austeni TaxID=7395 RepID=A0A1A9VHI0_GLOAU
MGPVLPPRSVMSGIPTHHYSAPMNFRKDLAARCSAKCVAIVSVTIFVAMCVLLIFLTGFGVLHWSPSAPCTVLVGNEASEVTAAKSTNTDLSKLHNYAPRSKTGQSTTLVTTVSSSLPSSSSASAAASSSSSAFQSTSASSVAVGAAAATSSATSSLSSSLANANNPGNYSQLLIIFFSLLEFCKLLN